MPHKAVERYVRKPYARAIIPDESGRYAAQVLELPGCFAEGATPEEAYRNLDSAAESWLDSVLSQGMEPPEPFAAQGYSGAISLRLPKSIHRRAAEHARRDGVSLNQFLLSAIAARVGAEDLVGRVAAKLDDRIERLGPGGLYYAGGLLQLIPAATTSGRPPDLGPDAYPSVTEQATTTLQTPELVPEKGGIQNG